MSPLKDMKKETAIFAAGCFWGVQGVFDQVPGVLSTVVGYTGGKKEYSNPNYELVCSGKTGHAEAVRIEFDPKKVSYEELLEIFWMNHDPTTLNRQGADVGKQYRSAIFAVDDNQKINALKSKNKNQKKFSKPIVTEINDAGIFYPAEDYHQKYYLKHKVSCHLIMPNKK